MRRKGKRRRRGALVIAVPRTSLPHPFALFLQEWDRANLNSPALYQGAAFSRAEKRLETNGASAPGERFCPNRTTTPIFLRGAATETAKKPPKIENARDRSLWRFNLDHSQYSRCCVLRLPQWPPSSFRWRCYLWLRWLSELRLASAPCTPARPVANLPARIGFVSSARPAANHRLASAVPLFRSTFGDPSSLRLTILVSSGLHPTILVPSSLRRMVLPPARPTTYFRFTSDAVLWLGWRLHPACATCCPCPPAGSASSLHRLLHPPSSPAVNLSACASWLLLRLSL